MKVTFDNNIDLSSLSERLEIAHYIATVVNRCDHENYPYKPNESDSFYWTVDESNDWKVKFFPNDPKSFQIIHRYNNAKAVLGLSEWLAYRLGGKVVE